MIVLLPLLLVLVLVILLVRLGQGGSRAAGNEMQSDASAVPVGDRTEDRYWRMGFLYFNPDDPAVLVEKRFGIGYTLNFARPASWLILLLILASALVPIMVIKMHG